MKAPQPQSITSLPRSREDERRSRMTKYLILMSVRVVGFVACFFVQGWWLLVIAIAVILLPYIAVVIANTVNSSKGGGVLRPGDPGALAPVSTQQQGPVE